MAEHHRKIDLQAPADLTYLRDNINDAAQKKLDLHIPPSAAPQDGDDAFRTKVEELVNQYIAQTLSLALPSIAINGLDTSPSLLAPPGPNTTDATTGAALDALDPSYEPYDSRLAEKVRLLHAQLEAETTKLAELRREAPARAAAQYAERLQKEIDAEQREMEALRQRAREEGERRAVGGTRLARAEQVAQSWAAARKGLEGLRGVTEVVAKGERAGRVVGEAERL